MSEPNPVIKKIQTLLDIGQRKTTNEHEADAALAKAQELLAKHNLSMVDVVKSENEEYVIVKSRIVDTFSYMRILAGAVAKMYFCKYFYSKVHVVSKKTGKAYERERHCFAGLKHNADVALMMFEYLTKTVTRLAHAESEDRDPTVGKWSFITAFQVAASDRISDRIYARIPRPEADSKTPATCGNTLPALVSLYQDEQRRVEEFLKMRITFKEAKHRSLKYDPSGFYAGQKAGDTVGLDTQVGQRGKKKALSR